MNREDAKDAKSEREENRFISSLINNKIKL